MAVSIRESFLQMTQRLARPVKLYNFTKERDSWHHHTIPVLNPHDAEALTREGSVSYPRGGFARLRLQDSFPALGSPPLTSDADFIDIPLDLESAQYVEYLGFSQSAAKRIYSSYENITKSMSRMDAPLSLFRFAYEEMRNLAIAAKKSAGDNVLLKAGIKLSFKIAASILEIRHTRLIDLLIESRERLERRIVNARNIRSSREYLEEYDDGYEGEDEDEDYSFGVPRRKYDRTPVQMEEPDLDE